MLGYQEWRAAKDLDNKFAGRRERERLAERERLRDERKRAEHPKELPHD